MKTKRINTTAKNIFLGIFTTIILFSFNSCTKKVPFLTSLVVPAAHGYVKVNTDNNQNYTIKVYISDLAEVERLQNSKQTYVVWMQTDQRKVINLGQLNSSKSFLSNQLTASLETISSYKSIKIFISAEETINDQYPGEEIVLITDKF